MLRDTTENSLKVSDGARYGLRLGFDGGERGTQQGIPAWRDAQRRFEDRSMHETQVWRTSAMGVGPRSEI